MEQNEDFAILQVVFDVFHAIVKLMLLNQITVKRHLKITKKHETNRDVLFLKENIIILNQNMRTNFYNILRKML